MVMKEINYFLHEKKVDGKFFLFLFYFPAALDFEVREPQGLIHAVKLSIMCERR